MAVVVKIILLSSKWKKKLRKKKLCMCDCQKQKNFIVKKRKMLSHSSLLSTTQCLSLSITLSLPLSHTTSLFLSFFFNHKQLSFLYRKNSMSILYTNIICLKCLILHHKYGCIFKKKNTFSCLFLFFFSL